MIKEIMSTMFKTKLKLLGCSSLLIVIDVVSKINKVIEKDEYERRFVFHDSIKIFMPAFAPKFPENHACVTGFFATLLL